MTTNTASSSHFHTQHQARAADRSYSGAPCQKGAGPLKSAGHIGTAEITGQGGAPAAYPKCDALACSSKEYEADCRYAVPFLLASTVTSLASFFNTRIDERLVGGLMGNES